MARNLERDSRLASYPSMNAMHLNDQLSSDAAPTFLFTDIEGSTEKWESEPARMAQAVAHHDELMRATVEAHHGRVMKSTGDGIYAVFVDPLDAVRTVVAIQIELRDPAATAGVPLMVRCGIHCGEAQVRG